MAVLITVADALKVTGINNNSTNKTLISESMLNDYMLTARYGPNVIATEPIYGGMFFYFSSAHAYGYKAKDTVYSVSMSFFSGANSLGTLYGGFTYNAGEYGGLPTEFNSDSCFGLPSAAFKNGVGSIYIDVAIYSSYGNLTNIGKTSNLSSAWIDPGGYFIVTINTNSTGYGEASAYYYQPTTTSTQKAIDLVGDIPEWAIVK